MEILLFVSSHCSHCPKAEAVVKRVLPEYREYGVTLKKIRTKTPEGKELCSKFGIMGLPTILILSENGNEIKRITGAPDTDRLRDEIENGLGLKKSLFSRIFKGA